MREGGFVVCHKTSANIVGMGSGKGKVRRVASISVSPRVGMDYGRWESFVETAGLEDVKVRDYYDIHPADTDFNQRLTFVQALFADLCAVGALGLGSGGSADDFELFFAATPSNRPLFGDDASTLYVRKRGDVEGVGMFTGPNLKFLDTNFSLGSGHVAAAVGIMLRAVSNLRQ